MINIQKFSNELERLGLGDGGVKWGEDKRVDIPSLL